MHTKHRNPLRDIAIFLALVLGSPAWAATITVATTSDAGGSCPGANCTLRQAIAAASPGDTIDFSLPASSIIELTSGELRINKDLTIEGPGAQQLTVERKHGSGVPLFNIFDIFGNVTISG
jgi:CSLREA domain-containing protein